METYSMINFFGKKKETAGSVSEALLDPNNIPRHVAIIMDGNGRWAKRKGLPRSYGHRAGADTLKRIVVAADDLGIKVLTVYAFSTENWKRPDEEVSYIMKLMKSYLSKNLLELKEHNVQLHVIGDMKRLHPDLQDTFSQAEAENGRQYGPYPQRRRQLRRPPGNHPGCPQSGRSRPGRPDPPRRH
jgi:undecaprenyl diphosphate synthase